ncbi:MAG: FAD/NAD(P)-binding oxidoreductase [Candidatus Sulfotelmatobacter sp.]
MNRNSPDRFEVLVVGGGPAGMAAAVRAAECGARVGIVDDNAAVGGQIWRGSENDVSPECMRWRELLKQAGVAQLCGMKVFDQPSPGVLLAEGADEICELRYTNLVIATGARERFLPFPGWTLPNVMGAGGLQAMVKCGLPIRGKRVVVAGTGPLLLAVSAYFRKHGAEIPIICEQASWSRLAAFFGTLFGQSGKIMQAVQLKRELSGISFAANSWVTAVHGKDAVESVTISRGRKLRTIHCDYLACGFHLVPNAELAALLGCRIDSGFVQVNEFQRTSMPQIFCAGEPAGIGGVELSIVEGEIAGMTAGGRALEARKLFGKKKGLQRFARALDRAFRLRPELTALASAETIVCRCEDVAYARLQKHSSWRVAKLQTRCGMGACQGRICGPATEFLLGWRTESVRPPIFPARVESLTIAPSQEESEAVSGGRR